MELATRVQTLDEAVCLSHTVNTPGKGMNPIILLLVKVKSSGKLGSFTVVTMNSLGEEKLWIKTC